jgi:hypothetical protein
MWWYLLKNSLKKFKALGEVWKSAACEWAHGGRATGCCNVMLRPVRHVLGRDGRFASEREAQLQIWRSQRLLAAADDSW